MRLKDKLSMSDQRVYLLKATTYKVHYCVSQNVTLYPFNIFSTISKINESIRVVLKMEVYDLIQCFNNLEIDKYIHLKWHLRDNFPRPLQYTYAMQFVGVL